MWKAKFSTQAEKKFRKLDRQIQERVRVFIRTKLEIDPLCYSTLLIGNDGYSRARVGDYRIIFELKNEELVIILIDIDHRKQVYK